VPGCGHGGGTHTVLPKEFVEQGGVHRVGVSEVEVFSFFPILGVHFVDEPAVAVAIVGSEGRLSARAGEGRGHGDGARVVAIHGRDAEKRFNRADHVDGRVESVVHEWKVPAFARFWQRRIFADDQGSAAV